MADRGFPIHSLTAVLDSAYAGAVMTGMQWSLGPDGKVLAYPGTGGGGGGGTVPTGTGFIHVTSGSQDGVAQLVTNADVATGAGIIESKLALNYATHSNALDHSNSLDHSNALDHANTNDPTTGQKAALVGTSGTPGSGNKYVTDADSRLTNSRTPTSHTHPASEVTDFSEAVDDRVAALLVAGSNITLTYNDGANTLTVAAASGSGIPALVGAKCISSGSYNLINGTPGGKSIFTTESWDTSGFFDSGSPGEFLIPTGGDGYYLLQAEGLISSVGQYAGERTLNIRNKTTPATLYATGRNDVLTNSWGFNISGMAYLVAGDIVEIVFSQGTASALEVSTGKFSITKVAT